MRPRRNRRRPLLILLLLLLVAGVGVAGVSVFRVSRIFGTKGQPITNQVREVVRAAVNPRDAFPGKDRLYILGLGIDANHDSRGIMYTKNARSDTIFVASLDLVNKRVGMLSIPRDTRVELAQGHGTNKINAAHAIGGVPLTKATVEEFLGVQTDHYIVIKMHGTRNFIDALGGVQIDVEKDMDYDDNWGNLHIHLKKGPQRLNGEQTVGYVRFRHDNESDFGRMRRQQQLVKAVAHQLMSASTIVNLERLVDTAMENVETDLTRAQLLALVNLFRDTSQERIHTGTIPGYDQRHHGVWYLDPSESKKEALVGWLLHGEESYRNGLVTIRVHNASGVNGAAGLVSDILSDQGYRTVVGKNVRGSVQTGTRIVDVTGNSGEITQQVAALFPGTAVEAPAEDEKPEIGGPDILLYVGKDTATALTAPTSASQ